MQEAVMASAPSNKKDRPPKFTKGGTASSRRHHFESFNQRIAKLSIDPIRRVRRIDVAKDDLDSATSYFKTGLTHWRDLNLSENFTAFVRDVEPLCDSLPHILHFEEKIVDTLVEYMEKKDALSLEPLLDLVARLAHDLGVRFESHFLRVVTLVAMVASNSSDVEVIEWSFTCLAWLFKYFSRLLVPDLRPIYNIMAPLLGKEGQKPHIARFAAEVVSFLVRKSALAYHKNKKTLSTIIVHILNDLGGLGKQSKDSKMYEFGLMTLFSDAIRGVGRGIHSCGAIVYECLLDEVGKSDDIGSAAIREMVRGTTISLIHNTDGPGFNPVLEVLLRRISCLDQSISRDGLSFFGDLLFVVCATRKGSRIQNWEAVVVSLVHLVELRSSSERFLGDGTLDPIERATAVILQAAPLDVLLPKLRIFIDDIKHNDRNGRFLLFCNYFSDLGNGRFQDLLTSDFFEYVEGITHNWLYSNGCVGLWLHIGESKNYSA
jgi:U3 small nucleolar RNA-associated protein 20